MTIKEMFKKDIDRNIQGVVKIGQDTNEIIKEELDEYVVTRELNKHFDNFFANYNKGIHNRTDKIGVWISGFFGSGKSHFLKILSYLLKGEDYEGKRAVTYFDDKIMDKRILADMKASSDITTDVILFNIDAKSDSDSKLNKDAIVKVFMKVFNEQLGFCGSMPWIADLERQMLRDGVYSAFKARFEELSESSWADAREDFYFEEDNIVQALVDSTKMSVEAARNWYNKADENYSLDIVTFARKVREYIESKGKKHNVVFLCDEIGQYIGTDSNLMLNLQTIVENLGTECGGRAWVIVTSQQDIDSLTNVSRDNFSKIIGRFDTRLILSSANVDEVIKKRLLEKTDTAKKTLKLLYADKSAILKNLITFSADTPDKKKYRSEDEFVEIYPFIPYQFDLLQSVFTGIRIHGLSGKHLSQGERSLLNAFQEAAKQFKKFEGNILVPFDAFYSTIETFLDHNISSVILKAADNSKLYPYDIAVLKVLFMLKYISNELPANLENLSTIMLTNIDEDKIELKKRIDASLRNLESEKLIIKNGDVFVFLTHEEQDVNREIREIRIDTSEIIDKIGETIFADIYDMKKYRKPNTNYDFAFNAIIDDRARGAQKEEIGIRIITPYYVLGGDMSEHELKALSMREKNIIVKLPNDATFYDEMEQALQIDRYIRRNAGKTQTDAVEEIKLAKSREFKNRGDRSKDLLIDAIKRANFYVNHNRLDIKEKSPVERINDAFEVFIDGIYTKQNYIKKSYYSSEDLKAILTASDSQLMLEGAENKPANYLAITEMSDVITMSATRHIPMTIASLKSHFSKAPYGWNDNDIAGILLLIYKTQEVRLELNGESITGIDLNVINYVTKRDYSDRVLIKQRIRISPDLLTNAKNLAKDLFNTVAIPNDEDGLMDKYKALSRAELYGDENKLDNEKTIKELLKLYENKKYPGKQALEQGKGLFENIIKMKDSKEFYAYLNTEKETILDYVEDVIDVKKFFKNQRVHFDETIRLLGIYEKNRAYMLEGKTSEIVSQMEKIVNDQSPYSQIQKLPELIEQFIHEFSVAFRKEREPIQADIEADFEFIKNELASRNMPTFSTQFNNQFSNLLDRLKHANDIFEAIAMKTESDRLKLRQMTMIIEEDARNAPASAVNEQPPVLRVKTVTVSMKNLVSGTKTFSTSQEIDVFAEELKDKLKRQLADNTVIKLM